MLDLRKTRKKTSPKIEKMSVPTIVNKVEVVVFVLFLKVLSAVQLWGLASQNDLAEHAPVSQKDVRNAYRYARKNLESNFHCPLKMNDF